MNQNVFDDNNSINYLLNHRNKYSDLYKSEKIFLLVTKTRILKMSSHAKSVLERVENIMTSKM